MKKKALYILISILTLFIIGRVGTYFVYKHIPKVSIDNCKYLKESSKIAGKIYEMLIVKDKLEYKDIENFKTYIDNARKSTLKIDAAITNQEDKMVESYEKYIMNPIYDNYKISIDYTFDYLSIEGKSCLE